jgi:hypothetical protein
LTLIRVSSAAFGASDQDIILNVRQSRELTTVGGSKPMGPLLLSGNIEQEVEREGTDHLGTLATEPLASFWLFRWIIGPLPFATIAAALVYLSVRLEPLADVDDGGAAPWQNGVAEVADAARTLPFKRAAAAS